MLRRESGRPCSYGSSQASALTATTTSGKSERVARRGEFLEASEAVFGESFPPLAHDLARRIEPRRDRVVGHAFGGIEHDSGADHVSIR